MSLNHGSKIVTDGLVLMLDAANIKSFPGEPTTNYFTYSEEFNSGNNVPYRSTFTENFVISPINTLTGDLFAWNGSAPSNCGFSNQGHSWTPSQTYTYSIYVKYKDSSSFSMSYVDRSAPYLGGTGVFNILTGTVYSTDGGITSSNITPSTNGWYRCSITFTTVATITYNYVDTSFSVTTTGQGGYLWGAQLEKKDHITNYIKSISSNGVRGTTVATGGGWKDISGKNNHWDSTNTIQNNNSIIFSGQTLTRVASTNWQLTNECTIECWYYPVSNGIYTGCCDTIFGRYWFRFFQIGGVLYTMMGFANPDGSYNSYQHPTFSVAYDTWHHVLGIRRSDRYIIWIDGVEMYNTNFGTGLILHNTTEDWAISSATHSNVRISNIKIYNRGLLDSEILQNYNATKGRYGLS